jgi:hypothetical protein
MYRIVNVKYYCTVKYGTYIAVMFYYILAYLPGVARVFIYPSLIVICVPSLAEIAHLHGILLMQPLLEEPNFRRVKRRLPIDLK